MELKLASHPIEGLRRPGGPLVVMRKTWGVLKITLLSRFAYLGELLVRSVFIVLVMFIFTQLWRATGSVQQTGFSLTQLIWYLAFTEAIATSVTSGATEVDQEVRSGDIAYRLLRPLPYPLHHFGAALGERLLRFAINLLVGMLVALIVVGPLALGPQSWLFGFSAVLAAFVADWLWTMSISLLSFWFEDTQGLHFVYRRIMMVLGGMLIPIDAYPEWLQRICRLLPFQYLYYAPARLFVRPEPGYWVEVLGILALIGLVGCAVMLFIYRLGLRQVSAQGG
jgi:ABC-2 type transport system permease protein